MSETVNAFAKLGDAPGLCDEAECGKTCGPKPRSIGTGRNRNFSLKATNLVVERFTRSRTKGG